MDSQYVYDGLKGSAFRWRASGWVGQTGPVCNVDLRMVFLNLVDNITPTVRWRWVPSHTDIPGNERADSRAEEGRVSSLLYHVLSLPERSVLKMDLPSTPTPRRAPVVPRSLEIGDVITPLHDTPAFCSTAHGILSHHNTADVLPNCLDFLSLLGSHFAHAQCTKITISPIRPPRKQRLCLLG